MSAVYLETYGCQMNEYDSELIVSLLSRHGYAVTSRVEEAEVVLLNTCAIRENAHRKVYGRLDRLYAIKRQREWDGHPFVVGLLGCMAQNLKERLLDHPAVNLVMGPDNYRALPERIDRALQAKKGGKAMEASLSEYETYSNIAPARKEGVNGWIAIMRGCDNFCSFCVVPYTRGRERSRAPDSIVNEAQSLAEQGYRQVTLLGQNVNSYRHEGTSFADLLVAVSSIPGLKRIRFTSPHPKDFPPQLLSVMAQRANLCKHIHLPLQSGSDRILDRMNRTYTVSQYLHLVETIRSILPTATLTTDIIVGFPTETEADFAETVRRLREVQFDHAYIFKYSERRHTIAARDYPDDVLPEIKTERIVRLLEIQREISWRKHQDYRCQEVSVLIEGEAEKDPDCLMGKTDGNISVLFPRFGIAGSDRREPASSFLPMADVAPPAPLRAGQMVQVYVEEAAASTLYGRVVSRPV